MTLLEYCFCTGVQLLKKGPSKCPTNFEQLNSSLGWNFDIISQHTGLFIQSVDRSFEDDSLENSLAGGGRSPTAQPGHRNCMHILLYTLWVAKPKRLQIIGYFCPLSPLSALSRNWFLGWKWIKPNQCQQNTMSNQQGHPVERIQTTCVFSALPMRRTRPRISCTTARQAGWLRRRRAPPPSPMSI